MDELEARISAASVAPAALAPLMPQLQPLMAKLLDIRVRGALDRLIVRLPEGPPEHARRAARWTIIARAEARDGRVAQGVVSGPDIYGLTAVTITDGAQALAPEQAFYPAATLDGTASFGVRWSVEGP